MVPAPPFAHVRRLSDARGIFEHAEGITPRQECGYCLDDVARALVVVCREQPTTPELGRLAAAYFGFVVRAQAPDGRCYNRLDRYGRWEDRPETGDWWGRALWGMGTAAARGSQSWLRDAAAERFAVSAARRSTHLRSMCFASLGAAEMLTARPGDPAALGLLSATVTLAGRVDLRSDWPWPEPRLSYANAAVAEALIVAGHRLADQSVLAGGLGLLGWLLETQTVDGHLSVVPVGGRGPGDPCPAFDQQPIEVAALADACVRALDVTGDPRWAAGLDLAVGWFLGDNDLGLSLYEPETGGGYDALTANGRNTNQGAESTLAMVSTLQHGYRLAAVGS